MIKNRRRSMAFKMALAGMCTALCLESMLQRGLYVPVHAEDTEGENYVGSSEWEQFIDYWHSSMNVAVDDLTGGAFDADDVAKLNTATYAYASMLYQKYAVEMMGNSPADTVSSGSFQTGWYYRGGKPHSVIIFFYGQRGDPCTINDSSSIVYASADDFTISIDVTLKQDLAYHTFFGEISGTYPVYYANQFSLTFNGTTCSGFMSNVDFTDWYNCYLSSPGDSIVTFDDVSLSSGLFVTSGYNTDTPSRHICGVLADSGGSPISNTRQEFIRASVGNNFPAFLKDLKSSLDDNFPPEIVALLWYDPTQGEPLPDVGSLDSLTFPSGLPSSSFNDVQLPSEPLPAKMLSGAGFWFTQFTNMIDAFGVKYIVIIFLIIALIMAILKI